MSVGPYSVFLSLQSLRQGMNWRYRDFAIENLALFQQNYRFIDTSATGEVAGSHPGVPGEADRWLRLDPPALRGDRHRPRACRTRAGCRGAS
ncbi:MAG: hypothetical protein IPK67_20715 [Planctomycetes bacterium]|nr:hypothetical protein [Planctomycetota bacterium]